MAASMAAKALRSEGIDVIDLGMGEPDFPTPPHVIEATHTAMMNGETLYTPSAGTLPLRRAIVEKFRRDNQLDYSTENILVANGAKQIIFNALLATLNPGDQVILPAPYFVSYPEMVKLLDGVPVVVPCPAETQFRLTPAALAAAITPRTKWLFLNSPNNPSGIMYTEAAYRALAIVLARHPHVMVLADEIYEHILFDRRHFVSFGQACPELKDRLMIVNGVAKSYAMTGWRVGYAAGPVPLITALATVQSQSCTSVAAPMQAGAVAALTGSQACVEVFRAAFERRRDLVVAGIAKIKELTLHAPEGAFYAFIGCADLIGRRTPAGDVLVDDTAVSMYLLNDGHVATVPGVAYGLSPFFRISTAAADTVLEAAIERIAQAVARLKA